MSKAILLFVASSFLGAATVFAAELQPFNQQAFEDARAQGKTVVLQFHQQGCGTCAKQKTGLQSVVKDRDPASVVALQVEFDPASELAKRFRVTSPSTLVVLKGQSPDPTAKEVGVTDTKRIEDLLLRSRI